MALGTKARFSLGLVVVAALVTALVTLPVGSWLLALVEWVRGAGALGLLIFAFAYIGAAVLLLPGSLLTLAAGFVYGPVWGVAVVSPVSVTAATASFLIGRFAARDWVARKVGQRARIGAIDEAIGEGGLKIVVLVRLSPVIPFNLLNYALGVTRVRLRDYILGSFLGMLPGTVLFVYLGSLVTSASELAAGKRPDAGPLGTALYVAGFAATILVSILISRKAKRALDRSLSRTTPAAASGEAR